MDKASLPVWVSPMPPLPTGISQYSADLLGAVSGRWSISVLPERGSDRTSLAYPTVSRRRAKHSPRVLHVGNSGFHDHALTLAEKPGGILVLHDAVLHHARLATFVRRGKPNAYRSLMKSLYGADGEDAARSILAGAPIDIDRFPLSEDLVRKADRVIVHSVHAAHQILERSPDIPVDVVPMGIPLPVLIDKTACRRHFGLDDHVFVISSITHVNPMKRIPVVLRAFRQLLRRYPDVIFVIAGSVSEGMDLQRQVDILGLRSNVRIMGYVSDNDARVLARASDVCVNLRYPSTGETSASLLRLLGAGVPVIVTRHGSANEVPDDSALHIPVDSLEEETLCEYLSWLASDPRAVSEIGRAGRQFVEQHHAMGHAVNAYRKVFRDVWNIDLPALPELLVQEWTPVTRSQEPAREELPVVDVSCFIGDVADAIARQGLSAHGGTIQRVAEAIHHLGIRADGRGVASMSGDRTQQLDPDLLKILACPVCKSPVRLENDHLKCESCGRTYRIENGIPIMLPEDEKSG